MNRENLFSKIDLYGNVNFYDNSNFSVIVRLKNKYVKDIIIRISFIFFHEEERVDVKYEFG